MAGRKYFRERHDPSWAPKALRIDEVREFLVAAVELAWDDVNGYETLKFDLRTRAGLELSYNPIDQFVRELDEHDLFSLVEFLLEHDQSGQLRHRADEVLVHYGDGYKIDEDGNIVSTGVAGLAEVLDRKGPTTETEENRQKLDLAVLKFRHASSTRENKKEAVRLLWEVIESRKIDFEKVVPRREASQISQFANKFKVRHHGPDQDDEYPDAYLEWMFVRSLATVHLYWDLKQAEF